MAPNSIQQIPEIFAGVAEAAIGIETGPGALLSGLVGRIVFGAAGYFGADWIADHIYEN